MSNKYDYVPENPDRYDLEAVKIIDAFRESDAVSICALYPIIGKALRNAANEAAWDGYEAGRAFEHSQIPKHAMEYKQDLIFKYGPKEASNEQG